MMRRSIAAKLFAATLCVFVLVLIIQLLFMSAFFDKLYINSMLSGYQQEFSRALSDFQGENENSLNLDLRQYSRETGTPVLAFDSSYRLVDRQFMSYFPVLTVKRQNGELIKVPVGYLDVLKDQPSLRIGIVFRLRAVQIGDSSYWEPLIITTTNSYTNRASMRRYRIDEADVTDLDEYVTVSHVQYLLEGTDAQRILADILFDAVKDCLITRPDIKSALADASARELTDSYGNTYRLFYERVAGEETDYFLVTLRKILFSGREQLYLNQFFYVVYGILALFLVVTAYGLSRFVSRPLEGLNNVTHRLAGLDFSVPAQVRGEDELAQLAGSINTMSENLQRALSELKSSNAELHLASQQSKLNEERMQVLLADLAHEFKTPLGIISSYTEIFEKNLQGGHAAEYYAVIDSEIEQLTEMVNEVIELSHIQNGSWSIEPEPCELTDIVSAAVAGFSKRFEQGGFRVHVATEDLTVLADPRRIMQVLQNILSNATRYCDERRTIHIRTRRQGNRAHIALGNTGTLSETDRHLIWERYYKKSDLPFTRLPSEGIGLDIVRRILTRHGSEYDAYQEGDMVWFVFDLELWQDSSGPVDEAE